MTAPASTTAGRPPLGPVSRGCLVAGATTVAVLLLQGPGPPLGPTLAGAAQLVLNLVAVVMALRLGRSREGRERRSWLVLAAAFACWLWTGSAMALQPVLGFRLADVGLVLHGPYVAGLLLTVVALLLFPARPWARRGRSRHVLEAATLFAFLLLLLHLLVLRAALAGTTAVEALPVVAYAVLDLVLVVLAVDVVRRTPDRTRAAAVLLAGSMAVWSVADATLYAQLVGSAGSSQRLSDALFAGGFGFAVGAALAARTAGADVAAATSRRRSAGLLRAARVLGPDVVVVGGLLTAIVVGPRSAVDWGLVALAGGLNAARQVLLTVEAHQTRAALERRVEARTEELRELTSQQGRILDAVGEGIVGVDPEGLVSFVNPRTLELLDVSSEQLLGAHVCDVLCRPGHLRCDVLAMLRSGDQLREEVEASYQRGDGTLLPVEVNLALKTDTRTGGHHGVVLAFRDVRGRRAVEQHKNQFVSSVSHELRTPLTAIRGVLEVLADGDAGRLPPTAQGLVDTADRAVRRLGRLVDDIIDVERLASGTFGVTVAPTELEGVVRDAITSLHPVAEPAGVALVVAPMSLPLVSCDPDRIVQAVVNLVGNAVKFSPAGATVTVSASQVGAEVVVRVGDEGRGIPDADLARVFDRFHQVAADDATERGGAGLGLTITRSIVQRHGGRIWVESSLGVGSVFAFTLPVHVPVGIGPGVRPGPEAAAG